MNLASRNGLSKVRIVVMGYIVRGPLAGMMWHHVQYVRGLADLGHDVYFVEDSGDDPWACYNPVAQTCGSDSGYGLDVAKRLFNRLGLENSWCYYDAFTKRWIGPASDNIVDVCATADLVLNLSGSNSLRVWLRDVPKRAYVDTDPVFTQIRNLNDHKRLRRTLDHNCFFSFGENINTTACEFPSDGIDWKPTRQPMILETWRVTTGPRQGKFTTVLQWDNTVQDAPRKHNGRTLGRKSDSFEPYFSLPRLSSERFELALGGSEAPRDRLRSAGWELRNPLDISCDPWKYQEYIKNSKGEFSVAKHGYVVTRSGWFSERSACYLASARPVVVQDTGFSDWLARSDGVIGFRTPEEALSGIEDVNSRYPQHCEAARAIAEEYFDACRVLTELLERALN